MPAILTGLARRLVLHNVISEQVAKQAVITAREGEKSLVQYLVEKKIASAREVALAASEEFGDPVFDLDAFNPVTIAKNVISIDMVEKHRAVPLIKRAGRLSVALSDPSNLTALEEIHFNTSLLIDPVIVEEDKLNRLIKKLSEEAEQKAFGNLGDNLDNIEAVLAGGDDEDIAKGSDDAPIVRFVNKLLLDAIKIGASDLHFEPYERTYRVRFRQDGILREIIKPPVNSANKIAARIKVMAQLDISERRVPQDGRIKLQLSRHKSIDFRVSTCPTLFGEKIVLRILDSESAKLGIDMLGYEEDQKQLYLEALNQPQGMILVTGPTGSGKTVSLYTGVNILNTPERNISTAEDPVEINLEGVNQVNVNPRQGLTFASALRAFLRQDPDVILVGEIRDLETATIGVTASQTGHLVMSTLHTNSAPETLTRLLNMGVPSYNIATSVILIIAQRLARRLCNDCKEAIDVPENSLRSFGFNDEDLATGFTVYAPIGCESCNDGYKGRVGIYEVVKITDEIARIIMREGNSIEIADQCRQDGFRDLQRSALLKVMQGITSLEEIHRVTSG